MGTRGSKKEVQRSLAAPSSRRSNNRTKFGLLLLGLVAFGSLAYFAWSFHLVDPSMGARAAPLSPAFAHLLPAVKAEIAAHRLDPARRLLNDYSREHAGDAYVHYYLGLVAKSKLNYMEAIAEFNQEIRLNPAYAPAYAELGLSWFSIGDYTNGAQALGRAYDLDPSLPSVPLSLAISLARTQKYEAAERILQRLIEADPQNMDAEFELGMVYFQQRDYERARDPFETVLAKRPNHPGANYNLGLTLIRLGHEAQAQPFLEKHRQLAVLTDEENFWQKESQGRGNSAQVLYRLGMTYYQSQQYNQAISSLRRAVGQAPGLWQAYFILGQAYRETGQMGKAAEAYREASRINPTHFQTWFFLGLTYLDLDRPRSGEEALAASRDLQTWDYIHYHLLGTTYGRHGLMEKAEAAIRTSIQLNPQFAFTHYQLGLIWLTEEKYAQAQKEFDTAIELDSNHAGSRLGRAITCVALNQEREMEESVRKAVEINRLNPNFQETGPSTIRNVFHSYKHALPVLRRYRELWLHR